MSNGEMEISKKKKRYDGEINRESKNHYNLTSKKKSNMALLSNFSLNPWDVVLNNIKGLKVKIDNFKELGRIQD